MADRRSAELFGTLFEELADGDGPLDRRALARRLWALAGDFDFSHQQLECDEALTKLGLARRGVDPGDRDGGEVMLYGPEGDG